MRRNQTDCNASKTKRNPVNANSSFQQKEDYMHKKNTLFDKRKLSRQAKAISFPVK